MKRTNPTLEQARLSALREYEVLDSDAEPEFDGLTRLAASIFDCSISTVTILDEHRQWFKSVLGLQLKETHRDISFCKLVIEGDEPLIVEDAAEDPRFSSSPLVVDEPKLRFYAGIPLRNPEGIALGTFCIMDTRPKCLTSEQVDMLMAIAHQAMQLLELRRERVRLREKAKEAEQISSQLQKYTHHLSYAQKIAKVGSWELDVERQALTWSDEIYEIFEVDKSSCSVSFDTFINFVHPEDRPFLLVEQERVINEGAKLNVEHRILLPGGKVKYVHECAELHFGETRNERLLAGTVQDVTERKLAELERERLLASERAATLRAENNMEYFRSLFENSPGLYLVMRTDDLRIIAASNAYLNATMTRREQIVGKRLFEAFPAATGYEDGAEKLLASLMRAKNQGEIDIMAVQSYPIRDQDGQYQLRYWSVVNTPVMDAGERVSLIIHRVEDVTEYVHEMEVEEGVPVTEFNINPKESDVLLRFHEQKKMADRIKESEERYRLIATVTNDAIWDWNLKDHTLNWNVGMEKLFGFALNDLEPTVESWTNRIHADDIQRIEQSIFAVINGSDDYWTEEYRFKRIDGTYAEVEDRGMVFRDEAGEAIRMVGGMTDISFRKSYERKLKEQAGLLDNARDAILVRGLDHTVKYANRFAAMMYGYSVDEMVGRSIKDLLYPDDPSTFLKATQATIENGFWEGKIEQVRKDGSVITVEGNWSLVRNEEGEPESIFAINTDLTEKMQLEQKLIHAQKLESLGQLTGGIAHDFNNLLTVIIGNSQSLMEELKLNSRIYPLAEMILAAGERGAELTQRLLAFARRQDLEPRVIQLASSVEGVYSLLKRSIGESIEIKITHQKDLWDVFVDPGYFDSVLMNLCINARDAMPAGGKISIETSNVVISKDFTGVGSEVESGEYVRVSIKDNGKGMDAETLSKAIEPFFTTKEKGKGTGLGLSMVYGFTKQSGGHVKINSRLGQGTRVDLYLPRAFSAKDKPEYEVTDASEHMGHERVLLVEDDDLLRPLALRLLQGLGYEVTAASNGLDALEIIRGGCEFDLLFTDVIMPGGLNGPQLAEEAVKVNPKLSVLYASGYTDNAVLYSGNIDDSINLLHKPYTVQSLAEKIRLTLTNRH